MRSTWIPAAFAVLAGATSLTAQQNVTLPARTNELTEKPTPVFSVGREEGQSWEMLSSVTSLAFDAQDNLYVLDSGNRRVLAFDNTGKFVRQIGKEGGGPGEFSAPMGMAVLSDGDLLVSDLMRGFAIFTPAGEYRHQIPAGPSGAALGGTGVQAGPGGDVVLRTGGLLIRGPGEGPPEMPKPFIRRMALSGVTTRDGATTAATAPRHTDLHEIPSSGNPVVRSSRGGDTRMVINAPAMFNPSFSWGVLPDGGIAISQAAEYAVQVKDPSGRLVRTIGRTDRPRRVTKADQDAAREQRRKVLSGEASGGGTRIAVTMSGGGAPNVSFGGGDRAAMPPERIEEELKSMTFAEVMPIVQAITTDPVGRIWVERTPARVGDNGPIELITAEGRYIGTVSGVRRPGAVNANGTLAAWVERDDLDVERIVVRRLPANWK
jgi:hypothetical protein